MLNKKNQNILGTHQISSKIIEIIENTEEYCFLVTPYFKPWPVLQRALLKAAQKEKHVVFIVRQDVEQNKVVTHFNADFGFDVVFVENLHTKLYLNEKEALVSSMNLYDASKERNYELGYFLSSKIEARSLKDQVIDEDLLGAGQFEIVKGRYFEELDRREREEVEKVRKKELDRKESEQRRTSLIKSGANGRDVGSCIRCGGPIPHQGNYPMCMKCFQVWAGFGDANYSEKFCHSCGTETKGISMARPNCQDCRTA